MYKLIDLMTAINTETNVMFPLSEGNRHYQQYKNWLQQGNVPGVTDDSLYLVLQHEATQNKWVKEGEEDQNTQPMFSEKWSDGQNDVYNVNDIPTLEDEEGNPYLDPSYVYIAPKPDNSWTLVPGKQAYWEVVEDTQKLREIKAKENLEKIRSKRDVLIAEADVEVNKHIDGDSSAIGNIDSWKQYRIELRNVTDSLKKLDGNPKITVAELDVDNFSFPTKP